MIVFFSSQETKLDTILYNLKNIVFVILQCLANAFITHLNSFPISRKSQAYYKKSFFSVMF